MMHFKMDQQGEQCPEENHRTQNEQFPKVPNQDGFQNFSCHLKFKTQSKSVCQLEFYIAGNLPDQTVHVLPESRNGGYGDDGNTHQFTEGDQDY